MFVLSSHSNKIEGFFRDRNSPFSSCWIKRDGGSKPPRMDQGFALRRSHIRVLPDSWQAQADGRLL